MPDLYPLRFVPRFQPYLWGGDRLQREFGKATAMAPPIAESWEVVDHDDGQSQVAFGPWKGRTISDLMRENGEFILGKSLWGQVNAPEVPAHLQGRFPWIFKFLDARLPLSVQVHPNDVQGRQLTPPDLGKTEAWVVLESDPGSRIYAGLKPQVTPEIFRDAVASGETDLVLHAFEPKVGDCLFIPAGTVHALGAGLLIAEIQQASNTTYRLFDWNRVGADGQPRPLHVEAGMEVIDFERGPVSPRRPIALEQAGRELLVSCDKFRMERWQPGALPCERPHPGDPVLLAVLDGEVELTGDPSVAPLKRGETALIPAAAETKLRGDASSSLLVISPGG